VSRPGEARRVTRSQSLDTDRASATLGLSGKCHSESCGVVVWVGLISGTCDALLRYIVPERHRQLLLCHRCSAPRFVVFEPVKSHTRLLLLDQVDDSVEHL
jgi:hypothetical protein